jgi:hypothetical protein
VLEAVFVLLESPSPSRRIFIGSDSLPPLWFVVSVLQVVSEQVRVFIDSNQSKIQGWYQELGSGPPHFDGKNYQMWSKWMAAFLRGKGQPEFDRVHTKHLACRIWLVLKEADVGNAQVQARMYATYRREYENFTHLPGGSIDALF